MARTHSIKCPGCQHGAIIYTLQPWGEIVSDAHHYDPTGRGCVTDPKRYVGMCQQEHSKRVSERNDRLR